jgi:beta-aspartyl-peptidase (threonine type)
MDRIHFKNRKFVNLLLHKKVKILNIAYKFYLRLKKMRKTKSILLVLAFLICLADYSTVQSQGQRNNDGDQGQVQGTGPITLVVHGGAGTLTKQNMTREQEQAYKNKIAEAIDIGYSILENGGSALDAIIHTIVILENSPLFNAGKGAVFTHKGENELDASIMDGRNITAGAVAGVKTIKNPILAARAVMEQSPHVMLSGAGAEEFASKAGLEIVDPSYFYTERRYKSLERTIENEKGGSGQIDKHNDHKFGTVGVVALDADGNLAAGTSTGGTTNKKYGRIGGVVAYDIAAKVKYLEMDVKEAAAEVIHGQLKEMGGSGGVICLDRHGNYAMEFNTEGMYRGVKQKGKRMEIYIY